MQFQKISIVTLRKITRNFEGLGISKAKHFDPFTLRVSYGDMKVILTSESVDGILWCDQSNESY